MTWLIALDHAIDLTADNKPDGNRERGERSDSLIFSGRRVGFNAV